MANGTDGTATEADPHSGLADRHSRDHLTTGTPDMTRSEVTHVGPDDHLTIGEVVRRTGVPASALHFYERKGLISSERDGAHQRIFPRHMLRRISLIIVAKRLHIPLSDVAEVFAGLPADRAPTHKDRQRVSRRWKKQPEERRRVIESLEQELTGCIGCGCLSMKACPLLNPDDTLGGRGPGPVRLQRPGAAPWPGRSPRTRPSWHDDPET